MKVLSLMITLSCLTSEIRAWSWSLNLESFRSSIFPPKSKSMLQNLFSTLYCENRFVLFREKRWIADWFFNFISIILQIHSNILSIKNVWGDRRRYSNSRGGSGVVLASPMRLCFLLYTNNWDLKKGNYDSFFSNGFFDCVIYQTKNEK